VEATGYFLVLASFLFNRTDNLTAVNTSKNSAGTKSLGASNLIDVLVSLQFHSTNV
jgi:hypothetical protein